MQFKLSKRSKLKKASANTSILAVNKVNFAVKQGEIFGFLGPNGAGKTTTIRMLTGILKPTRGHSEIFGKDIWKNAVSVKQGIGNVPEMANIFPELTGLQNIMLIGKLYDIPKTIRLKKAGDLLSKFGLFEKRHVKTKSYSKGMKQRILLCMALINDPKILFLDEPTSGLDVISARIIKKTIKEYNKMGITVFLTTHDMKVANELCDRIAIINQGEILCVDTPDNLRIFYEKSKMISVTFNHEVQMENLKELNVMSKKSKPNGEWIFEVEDIDIAIGEILNFIRANSIKITQISSIQSSFEEIFLKIINGGIKNYRD
ncbi:MAG: ATP-binding cassette domain-containing protein [Candidatus Lokiarchaeota archaeon]|nr:ATP-binding cassette domain-containing protein [Candidatus Lokiarchaeota archaeon]